MSDKAKGETPEDWGSYMHQKKSKLKEQFQATTSTARETLDDDVLKNLFKCVSIYVNGYTKPSSDELKELIGIYGGEYHQYYSKSRTTHVIATNLCFSKIKNLRDNDKVVRPEWITESIEARKLLPVTSYLVYHPDQLPMQQQLKTSVNAASTTIDDSSTDSHAHLFDGNSNQTTCSESSPMKLETTARSGATLKAGDPGFLTEFFNKSRLHHLSSSGNDFKAYIQELRQQSCKSFDGVEQLKRKVLEMGLRSEDDGRIGNGNQEKRIMHIDMDCFFVSVGRLKRPHLVNKPVVVTHAKTARGMNSTSDMNVEYERNYYGNKFKAISEETNVNSDIGNSSETNSTNMFQSRSEIACASYEARAFGIKNGSYLGPAKQMCPELIEIPYDFEEYERISKILYDTLASFTLEIEAVSCDEMFVDVTNLLIESSSTPEIFASFLRDLIMEKSGCPSSIGIGPNILIAKLASKSAKPNGQLIVHSDEVSNFMATQKLRDLPGIGRTIAFKLAEVFGAESCGDLLHVSEERLKSKMGIKTGERLYSVIRGRDRAHLLFDQASSRKSVSAEVNYGIRLTTFQELDAFMKELSDELSSRLEKAKSKGKQLTLKMKIRKEDAPKETAKFMGHGVCNSMSRSTIINKATNESETIHKFAMTVIKSLSINVLDLRGIGIQMTKLEPLNDQTESKMMMIQDYFKEGHQKSLEKKSPVSTHVLVPKIFENHSVRNIPVATNSNGSSNPSCSSSSIFTSKNKSMSVTEKPATDVVSPLPASFEEIDQETLNALPRHIREEILTAFQSTSTAKSKPSSNGNSSLFNRVSPKKKTGTKKPLKGKSAALKGVTIQPKVNPKGPLDEMFKNMNKISERRKKNSKHTSVMKLMSTPGTLCGQKDVDKIAEIVTEWIVTESEPSDTDIAGMIRLFMDFIQLKEFTKLLQIADTFYEQVLHRDSVSWKSAFNTVSQIVTMELNTISTEDLPEELQDVNTRIPLFDIDEETVKNV